MGGRSFWQSPRFGPGTHVLYDPLSFSVGGTWEKGQMPLPLSASIVWQWWKGFADIQTVPISGFWVNPKGGALGEPDLIRRLPSTRTEAFAERRNEGESLLLASKK